MNSSQKFIARNRAPRVQIEYDVELYGAAKKVQLPFVMGVMSDLSGTSETPPVSDRAFLEIDVDNFNDRMKAIAPRAQFTVPNTLTGDGNLAVDLTFESMADFSPAAVAGKVDSLRPLLEARRQLSDLLTYMDGKAGAEALIEKLLQEPALLSAVGGQGGDDREVDAALASLRAAAPPVDVAPDETEDTLAALRAAAPADAPEDTSVADALGTLTPPPPEDTSDATEDVLASLERIAPEAEEDHADAILAAIEQTPDAPQTDTTEAVLASIEIVETPVEADSTADVLAGIEAVETPEQTDGTADVLASIEAVEEAPVTDETAAALASIEIVETPEEADTTADVLAGIEAVETPEQTDAAADVLAAIEAVEEAPVKDETAETLAGIEAVNMPQELDVTDDILASLEPVETAPDPDDLEDVLAGLEASETPPSVDQTADILAGLEPVLSDAEAGVDAAGAILAGLEPAPQSVDAGETVADVFAGLEAADGDDAGSDDDLDALLAGLSGGDGAPEASDASAADDLDALLAGLGDGASAEPEPDRTADNLASRDRAAEADAEVDSGADDLEALLADLDAPAGDTQPDDLDALLGELASDAPHLAMPERSEADDLDALLAQPEPAESRQASAAEADDLDALLAELDPEPHAPAVEPQSAAPDDLDALLADLGADAPPQAPPPAADAELDDLDALLADLAPAEPDPAPAPEAAPDDLDALMAELEPAPEAAAASDLDALLADLGADPEPETLSPAPAAEMDDLDALLADLGAEAETAGGDDLDALLSGTNTQEAAVAPPAPAQNPFGTISAPRPAREDLNRGRFRMAIFGDFTGRAARGLLETGDALAARRPIELDVDTVEDVIAGFKTTLTLPIGKDGAGIAVPLKELDDLHPDELYDNVEIFEALAGLKQQLGVGSMADRARAQLKGWSETYGTPVRLPKRSAATSVPPDLRLSDFQALIGDTAGTLTQASPIDEMLARIVGPHIVKSPDADAKAMQGAVDEALSSAMRLILHHPEFQAVESQWRSLDLLARRIETDAKLQIVLYDVSAQEMAADLAAGEDLAQSGIFRLLTDVLDPETGDGGFSALFGLYTFEETPPHAELLARIGSVAAHVDAPFFAAITPGYLETSKQDRHPLVAKAWDSLRALPEAGYLGLASPRFLLRQPYGTRSDPIYPFEFEEFTPQEGLSGMLWANPVVLVAILLAGTYKKDGKAMNLGSLMSLGEMPFHYVKDRYGDQVALPCTERNLTSEPAQATLGRGYMPVLWVKGRNEIRLGSFRALGGEEIAGPWSGAVPPPRPAAPDRAADLEMALPGAGEDTGAADAADASLDDLLASFEDDGAGDVDLEEMDPELAALLEGL